MFLHVLFLLIVLDQFLFLFVNSLASLQLLRHLAVIAPVSSDELDDENNIVDDDSIMGGSVEELNERDILELPVTVDSLDMHTVINEDDLDLQFKFFYH
jgi:hypothetical protein